MAFIAFVDIVVFIPDHPSRTFRRFAFDLRYGAFIRDISNGSGFDTSHFFFMCFLLREIFLTHYSFTSISRFRRVISETVESSVGCRHRRHRAKLNSTVNSVALNQTDSIEEPKVSYGVVYSGNSSIRKLLILPSGLARIEDNELPNQITVIEAEKSGK